MLRVSSLSVDYRGVIGLSDLSFTVLPQQLVGIMGPNGAGKSTLLKAMLGLIPCRTGRVEFGSLSLQAQRQRVAYVPQRSQIDWDYPITAWHVAMLGRTHQLGWGRLSNAISRSAVTQALERVGMIDLRHRPIGQLSGGQQQRVFLARALAQEADILLLDEPFTGVDQTTETILLQLFTELRQEGKIILVSGHQWGQALSHTDRLLLLNRELIADGRPEQVLTPENWQRAYGGSHASPQAPLNSLFAC